MRGLLPDDLRAAAPAGLRETDDVRETVPGGCVNEEREQGSGVQ